MENFIKSKEKDETRCVNSLRFYGSIIQNLVGIPNGERGKLKA